MKRLWLKSVVINVVTK